MKGLWKAIKTESTEDTTYRPASDQSLPQNPKNAQQSLNKIFNKVEDKNLLSRGTMIRKETLTCQPENRKKKYISCHQTKPIEEECQHIFEKQKLKILKEIKDLRATLTQIKDYSIGMLRKECSQINQQFQQVSKIMSNIVSQQQIQLKVKSQQIQQLEQENIQISYKLKEEEEKTKLQQNKISILNQNIQEVNHQFCIQMKALTSENKTLKSMLADYSAQIGRIQHELQLDQKQQYQKYQEQSKQFYIKEIQKIERQAETIGQKYIQIQEEVKKKQVNLVQREEQLVENLIKMQANVEELCQEHEKLKIKEEQLKEREKLLQNRENQDSRKTTPYLVSQVKDIPIQCLKSCEEKYFFRPKSKMLNQTSTLKGNIKYQERFKTTMTDHTNYKNRPLKLGYTFTQQKIKSAGMAMDRLKDSISKQIFNCK